MLANSASLSDSRHGSPHYNSAHSKRSNDNANEWRPCLVEVGKLTGEEHIHSFIVYVCGITSPIRIESIFVNEIWWFKNVETLIFTGPIYAFIWQFNYYDHHTSRSFRILGIPLFTILHTSSHQDLSRSGELERLAPRREIGMAPPKLSGVPEAMPEWLWPTQPRSWACKQSCSYQSPHLSLWWTKSRY